MPENTYRQSQSIPTSKPDHLIRHSTFRQLQIFESIYRLKSFTRAAEELFLTQPTVSMQLKKLSDAMGMPLFEHVGRSIEPTEAGNELYKACRQVFEILSNVEMKMADLKGLKSGRLRVGVITTAKYLAPELLGKFSQLYPGIDLSLKVTNRDRIIERMYQNEDDLYIMGQVPQGDIEMLTYKFAPNPLVIMAPKDHPLASKKNITLERISQEPFIIREPGSGVRDATLKVFHNAGHELQIRMELGSNEAIKHSVLSGLGLSVLSLHTMTFEGSDGPLCMLDVEGFPIMRSWYLVHPKGKELSLAAETFLKFAIECEPEITTRIKDTWPALQSLMPAD